MTDGLYAIEEGTMSIEGHTIRTYVLNDGRRMVNADDAERLLMAMGLLRVSDGSGERSEVPPSSADGTREQRDGEAGTPNLLQPTDTNPSKSDDPS